MKKYFIFDNEPISGSNYLIRLIVGSLLIILFGLGLWVIAATSYKRAGAFGWSKTFRIICSILIPIFSIFNLLSDELAPVIASNGILTIVALFLSALHLTLLFKNGNKTLDKAELEKK